MNEKNTQENAKHNLIKEEESDPHFYIDKLASYKYLFPFRFKLSDIKNGKAPSSEVVHRQTKKAWRLLIVYLISSLFFYIQNEMIAYQQVSYEPNHFISNTVWAVIMFICVKNIISLPFKRIFKPIKFYVTIILISLFLSPLLSPYNMIIKGYLFANYPQLCQTPVSLTKRASVCYHYSEEMTFGRQEALVFNPDDTMSKPVSQWDQAIFHSFYYYGQSDEYKDDDCFYEKTKLITKHLYWVSNTCWVGNN